MQTWCGCLSARAPSPAPRLPHTGAGTEGCSSTSPTATLSGKSSTPTATSDRSGRQRPRVRLSPRRGEARAVRRVACGRRRGAGRARARRGRADRLPPRCHASPHLRRPRPLDQPWFSSPRCAAAGRRGPSPPQRRRGSTSRTSPPRTGRCEECSCPTPGSPPWPARTVADWRRPTAAWPASPACAGSARSMIAIPAHHAGRHLPQVRLDAI